MKEYTALVSANILETEPAEEREEKSGVTYGTIQKVSYYSTTCKRTSKGSCSTGKQSDLLRNMQ